ncbi:glutamate synthase subunit beta [soil metagenome]
MSDPRGFLKHSRVKLPMRPLTQRTADFSEAYVPLSTDVLATQAQRCMNCGVPFCHEACPLGNPIPEFNDMVQQGRWREAYAELTRTNPFPEFTGKICPAPCEDACVLSIIDKPVTIKNVELAVIDHAFEQGWVKPSSADLKSGRNVAIVGSGPAGLACAQSLRKRGHGVTVFERSDRLGGLIRYGVPDYKMDKALIDRRVDVLRDSGVEFVTNFEVKSTEDLLESFDAVALCVGALKARELDLPGEGSGQIHLAMAFLTAQNRACAGDPIDAYLDARGKDVVILGGGDTGADCFGTAIRQGAKSVTQLNHYPEPGDFSVGASWPYADESKHGFVYDEGGKREWAVQAVAISDAGLELCQVWRQGRLRVPIPNSIRTIPADLVLIAIGFEGAELSGLGLGSDGGLLASGPDYQTSRRGVFVAGDVRKGPSLVVWAIAEGLNCAASIDRFLTGSTSLHRSYRNNQWAGLGR